ncbi:nucleoside recognition domain-containing protein [Cytobacillus sp. FJAT-54145]|uniref:Nucleoside recognition domain-containing protein n=1 Tax=Cytobacillus spartinae TaxID=3299023 RepID=A0ABW6KCW8_9BACI
MLLRSAKEGSLVGLRTTWALGKIIFPVALIVALLQHTPILPWLIKLIEPFMGIFGLSGDAAIPLVIGNFLNLYAAIGAILTIDLTVKEVFIIAVMLSFSHNMLVESSVAVKVGVKLWIALVVRIGLAIVSGIVINLVWQGGGEKAKYGFIPPKEEEVTGVWNIIFDSVQTASIGIFQLAIIVIPLMIAIQILKDLKWLAVFSRWMAPITRALGMKENTSTTLAAGLLFGLAYGAGVMIQAVKEDGVSKKDVTIAFIFLAACHAVVEDTLIFVPLGIPVLPLLLIRLAMAIILTVVVAVVWNRVELGKRKEATYEH